MRISEIFYTLQGEGPNIGKPAVFIRLAGCHLRCSWCDSKFTWKLKSGKEMPLEEIIKEIQKHPTKNLVITGGEPLLQQNALIELFKKLKNYYIEMETSGSIESFLNEYIDHYNCSPKLKNSGNNPKKLDTAYEKALPKLPVEKTYYKFVVDNAKDLEEIKSFIRKHKIPQEKILLMPQGIKKRELAEKSKWLAEICKSENLRFTPRLHINLWGNKRKV